MKSTIKTYGVVGLMEWQCLIRAGKATLHVSFTGGTLTGYGVTPARYTTRDAVIQSIIEHSDYFKRGRIQLLKSVETSEAEVEATPAGKQEDERSEKAALKSVELASVEDARQYLIEHFQAKPVKLLNPKSVVNMAREHGLQFIIEGKPLS